jgi:hypothetical protein
MTRGSGDQVAPSNLTAYPLPSPAMQNDSLVHDRLAAANGPPAVSGICWGADQVDPSQVEVIPPWFIAAQKVADVHDTQAAVEPSTRGKIVAGADHDDPL